MARAPRPRRQPTPTWPLAGCCVVEMSHHLAAPLAAMHLGDFGADVIKVASLEGEDAKRIAQLVAGGVVRVARSR